MPELPRPAKPGRLPASRESPAIAASGPRGNAGPQGITRRKPQEPDGKSRRLVALDPAEARGEPGHGPPPAGDWPFESQILDAMLGETIGLETLDSRIIGAPGNPVRDQGMITLQHPVEMPECRSLIRGWELVTEEYPSGHVRG